MKMPRAEAQPLLPDEVILEILSWLSVKPLIRLRCVCKSWKSLISDPHFVKLHLRKSLKNSNLILTYHGINDCVVPCSKRSFLDNPSSTILAARIAHDRCRLKYKYRVVGSCNGLVCLVGNVGDVVHDQFGEYWVRSWNPAIRLRSNNSPRLRLDFRVNLMGSAKFGFGYDESSDTYKVVAVLNDRNAMDDPKRTRVTVYTLGDSCWRDIQSFPAFFPVSFQNDSGYVSGTLNWLATRKFYWPHEWRNVTSDQWIIVSLNLGKETYKQLLLPDGLDKVSHFEPSLQVFMDCLCLSYDSMRTHFVVWQMKEFGVEKSWTQLLTISYQHLQVMKPHYYSVVPLWISENGDDLMLMDKEQNETIRYNQRNNGVERTLIPKGRFWINVEDHIQSLVLPC